MVTKERIFIILIMEQLRNYDVLTCTRKLQSYSEIESTRLLNLMEEVSMSEKVNEALKELIAEKNVDLFEELIRQQDIRESKFAEIALEKGIFRPVTLYENASTQVRDRLIGMLENPESSKLNLNGILLALAQIGDNVVVEAFINWEENPPAWREKLYVGPADYALEGGWSIEEGRKKELTYGVSYALCQQENEETTENVYGRPTEDRCPHCGSKYVDIMVVDGTEPKLSFLEIGGKIKIKTCKACLPYGDFIFCKYKENEESKVICHEQGDGDFIEDEELEWGAEKCFVLSEKPVAKHYCSEWDGSAIGGVPTYVNDANYAICPECGEHMKHLAQLDGKYTGYGNIYVQICSKCKIAATTYQQS